MPAPFKTEAIVLRSIRFGEADRILHLYSEDRGRLGAIAKGARRVKSRLGGRIEPFARVQLILREGRGDLCTLTGADTVHAHPALRERRASLERATQACDAVLRLLDSSPEAAVRAQALALRMKLLLAAGFSPELAACASCGEREHLGAFSAAAGGVVCPGCEAGSFPLGEEAHSFLVDAMARPLADFPQAADRALAQADRAIGETLEHHAHVRLRRVA